MSAAALDYTCRICGSADTHDLGAKNDFRFSRCRTCGTAAALPTPTEEELTQFYQNYPMSTNYATKRESKIRRSRGRLRSIVRQARGGKRMMDVGSNLGFTVHAAREMGLDAWGIDIDADAVERAKADFGAERFRCAPVADLAERGETYDIVYTSEVVEHVSDPHAFARNIAAITAPGGLVYLTTPDMGHWRRPRDFLAWHAVKPPRHLWYFTAKGLRHLFGAYGFEDFRFKPNLKPSIRMFARKKAA